MVILIYTFKPRGEFFVKIWIILIF